MKQTKNEWTQDQLQILLDSYREKGPVVCAQMLGLSVNAVKKRAQRLGICKVRKNFTKEEVEIIKRDYESLGPKAIGIKLDRPQNSVQAMASRMGLLVSSETRSRMTSETNKTWIRTEVTRSKIGNANRKHDGPRLCCGCGDPIRRRAERCKPCEAKSRGGENHPWWKGGITKLYVLIQEKLYKAWRYEILCRDRFFCQHCGSHEQLEVHHIRLLSEIIESTVRAYPELSLGEYKDRVELASLIVAEHKIEEGITLCSACHDLVHFGKRGELREPPENQDNPQLIRSNVLNFVDRPAQRLPDANAQINKSGTSAPATQVDVGGMR